MNLSEDPKHGPFIRAMFLDSLPCNPRPFVAALQGLLEAGAKIDSDEAKAVLWTLLSQAYGSSLTEISLSKEWGRLNNLFNPEHPGTETPKDYSTPVLETVDDDGQRWLVRLVRPGERYGRHHCLTLGEESGSLKLKKEPMVEFYSRNSPGGDYDFVGTKEEAGACGAPFLGYYVSRYYVCTLRDEWPANGLCLQGGNPASCVGSKVMQEVEEWLGSHNL
jgi:hypothetical protein